MKPTSRYQLARFLDQVRSQYPYGVARATIVAPQPSPVVVEDSPFLRYLFVVAGSPDSLTPPQRELLDGIIRKGLKLSQGEYETTFSEGAESLATARTQTARCTIIFGVNAQRGVATKEDGSTVLDTWQLQEILDTPNHKRELWKSLQELISQGV